MVTVAGATLVTDGLGLSILAGVAAAQSGELGAWFWVLFAAKLVAFVAAVLVIVPRLGRWFFRRVEIQPHTELIFLLLLLFGTSYLSQLAGLAPIVGAFLAGLTLNRMVPNASAIMGRVTFVGEALFVPLFLLSVGLLVDFGALTHGWEVWGLAAVFCAAVVGGKLAAALISARLFGYGRSATGVTLGLSIPQAAATLAVTLVGFDLELFDRATVNAVVVLILATCLLGPWLVGRYGRRLALEVGEQDGAAGEASARILIPLANPTTAGRLIDLATLLRPLGSPDPIHPLTVLQEQAGVEERVAKNERLIADAVMHAVAAGAPVMPVTRIDLNVVRAIVRAQQELRASLVVIGWTGQPAARTRIFGGVLDQLLHQCGQMIVVSRLNHALNTTTRVVLLLPSLAHRQPGFDHALREIKVLCQRLSTRLLVLLAPSDRAALEARLGERPQVALEVRELNQIALLEEPGAALAGAVGERDLVVLMGARAGTLAWQRGTGRLPGRLAAAFAMPNMLVVYPADASAPPQQRAEVSPAPAPRDPLAVPGLRWAATHGAREPLRAFVRHMLEAADEGASGETLDQLAERLVESARPAPIEVRPGLIFLSARAEARWPEARVFVGTCEEGVPLPDLHAPARVVVALVSPRDRDPAEHLENLSLIARSFLARPSVEGLSAVHTVEELRALLVEEEAP